MRCNKCMNDWCICVAPVQRTVINSDTAGRDGLSAHQIALLTGKTTITNEAVWIESLKGDKGEAGSSTTYIPVNEDNYFDI